MHIKKGLATQLLFCSKLVHKQGITFYYSLETNFI